MQVPSDLFYTEAHIWLKKSDNGLLLGVTDYAQESMGTLEFLDLPSVGDNLSAGSCFGSAETSKSVNDLFAPLDAVVIEINEELAESPEIINDSPYETGWILRVADYDAKVLYALLDSKAYTESIE